MRDLFFSEPQSTVEQAQSLYEYEIFVPAAVFKTPNGFVMGLIREQSIVPNETAKQIKEITGFEMVSHSDPITGIWKLYKVSQP